MRYKSGEERTIWNPVCGTYPRLGDTIMMFFPGQENPIVFAVYDDWDKWVPRPTHWAKPLIGPAVNA